MKKLIIILLLFICFFSQGTNRYVSLTGSDSNPGTLLLPFCTIQKAHDISLPGDSVIVKSGTYLATAPVFVTITRSGTALNPIVYKSEVKWGAILNGSNNVSGYCFELINGASHLQFIDFEITGFDRDAYFCNDFTYKSSNILIKRNKIHDIGRLVDGGDNAHNAIKVISGCSYWTITQNLIYNIGRTGPDDYWLNHDHAVYVGYTADRPNAAHHMVIAYNIIWGCSGHALSMGSDYDLYANNVIAWSNENHHEGLQYPTVGPAFINTDPGTKDVTIVNNIFYQPSINSSLQPHVIQSYSGGFENWSIKNNIIVGSTYDGTGRMCDPELYNAAFVIAMDGNNYGTTDCELAPINPSVVSAIKENAPNVNFALQAGSPAINMGADVGLTTDYLGNPIVGLPDIGAYEYTSSPSPTVYYNTQQSGTATKNNCLAGYFGSVVTYTVASSTYSSIVSQADADNQAILDVADNKQAYANANGICTLVPVGTGHNILIENGKVLLLNGKALRN